MKNGSNCVKSIWVSQIRKRRQNAALFFSGDKTLAQAAKLCTD